MADGILTPCNVAGVSDNMPLNSPKRPPCWNSTSGFDFSHITAVDMSFCTSLRNFIKSDYPRQKKITSCRFSRWRISAILDIRCSMMGSLKSQRTTSYRLSIDTITLNCLVFEKIAFLYFGDRQTNRQTNRQTDIIIIIIIYESCSAKSTNENDGALHSHKTLS